MILTDDQEDPKFIPTKQNILSAMQWLVSDAREDDSYVHRLGRIYSELTCKDYLDSFFISVVMVVESRIWMVMRMTVTMKLSILLTTNNMKANLDKL